MENVVASGRFRSKMTVRNAPPDEVLNLGFVEKGNESRIVLWWTGHSAA